MTMTSPVGRPPADQPATVTPFARLMRTRRTARGWTQQDLAMHARLSCGTINNLEMGRQQPSLRVALLLARTLDFSLDSLEDQS
jgi:transcriptional regulator with XRE-family HTH domain